MENLGQVNLRRRRSAQIHLTQLRLTFLYLDILGGYQLKKTPCINLKPFLIPTKKIEKCPHLHSIVQIATPSGTLLVKPIACSSIPESLEWYSIPGIGNEKQSKEEGVLISFVLASCLLQPLLLARHILQLSSGTSA